MKVDIKVQIPRTIKTKVEAGDVINPLSVTENGTYKAPLGVRGYNPVIVDVPIPEGYVKPEGTLEIVENGEYDVSNYATANVSVTMPQLYAPTISLEGDTLTIVENEDNGEFATSYDLYIDNSLVGNYTTTTIDLTTLELAVGTYSITVKAKGTNFVDSEASNTVSYVVVAYVEEANEYGTTAIINSYEEEANELGTTVIL